MKFLHFSRSRNIFKKLISTLCALCIVLSVISAIPFSAKAQTTEKMFVINPTVKDADGNFKCANVFIPLNFRDVETESINNFHYFKLTFKARNFSSGKPIVGIVTAEGGDVQGSRSEPYYAYNNTESDVHSDTYLTCNYDASTYTYTYIIKMPIGSWYSASEDGSHCAITIGNMEHNGGWYKENSPEAYFALAYPELYAYDVNTGEAVGDNLISGINDDTVNLGKVYTHKNGNPYVANDSLIMAPANKWGIDTTASLIEYKDIPEGYFEPGQHNYIKVEAVDPTETEPGNKEYYICDCGDCDGKYFLNNGASEVAYEDVIIQPNGPDKAIIIKPNTDGDQYPSNIFIPLDFENCDSKGGTYYFQLKFKTKIVDGNMPIVGVVRYNPSTGGSFSESEYSYNNQGTNSDSKLKASYDEATMTYSATIKVDLQDIYCDPNSGAYAAITIGKAEHNGNWYKENDFDSSFIIYQPELYRVNARNGKPVNNINLIAGINNNTVDLETSYTHRKNPYTSSDNLLNAPVNIWSVDGPTRYISVADVPEDFFETDKHNYIKHDAVAPTETDAGNIEYYTCDCDDCKDKYFTDFGLTEIKTDVTIAPNGPEKMIIVEPNNSNGTAISNVLIPIDHRVAGDAIFDVTTRYYKLSFKTKLYGDAMPVVSVVRAGDSGIGSYSEPYYSYNNNSSYWSDTYPALYSEYDEATNTFTAVIAVKTYYSLCNSESGAHHAILIGNAEHNGNWYSESQFETSFSIYEPELYVYDASSQTTSGDNILPGINDNTLNLDEVYIHNANPCLEDNNIMAAPLGKWSVDTTARLISAKDVDNDYFDPAVDAATTLKITGGKTEELISYDAVLKTTTKYKIDFDYKVENGATVTCGLYTLNSSGEMTEITSAGGSVITPDDNLEGLHFSRIISMPTGGINTAGKNFKIVIGVKSQTDDSIAYISNVKVKAMSATGECGNNVLPNGDFSFAPAGDVVPDVQLSTWQVADSTEYIALQTQPIQEGMFIDTAPNALYMDDFKGKVTTTTSITSGKTYLFRYKSKYDGEAITTPFVEFLTNSGSSVSQIEFMRDKDGYYNTVCEFTAPSGLLSGKNLRIGVQSSINAVDAVVSGFELYELDINGAIVSDNLISDATFINTNILQEYSKDLDEGIWSKELENGSVEIKSVGITFFNISPSQMMLFVGTNNKDGGANISQNIALQAGKQYQLSFNAKYADVGVDGDKLGAELQYMKAGTFVELSSTKAESDTEYKETYTFTMPSDAQGGENFKFLFHFSSAYTSGYAANFTLYEIDAEGNAIGDNLIGNGDFSTGNTSYWKKSGYYYRLEFNEIPENFFSKEATVRPNMVIYRNTDDYAELDYSPQLKPSTSYEFVYHALHTDYNEKTPPHVSIWQFYYNEKNDVVNSTVPNIETKTEGIYTSKIFTTHEQLYTGGNNNYIIRLYMRTGSAGYWGAVELYELDENGNRVSNNLIVNGDFTSGLKCWATRLEATVRVVEEPEGFFENWTDHQEMVYSNGSKSNESYGTTLKLDSDKKYYYSGFYINMNSEGVNPKVLYLPRSAAGTDNYKEIPLDIFYDSDRYFFEVAFEIPDDALLHNGIADIRIQMNNSNSGMGYFTGLRLCEDGKYVNLLTNLTHSNNGNYEIMPYDPGVFIFYYDDEKFDDGDWSGEWKNSKYNIKYGRVTGRVVDKDGNGISGIKMQLNPGNIIVTTDEYGNYAFEEIQPNKYKLYLIESNNNSIYCTDVAVQKGIWSMIPLITYSAGSKNVKIEETYINNTPVVEEDKEVVECGILRGFYYTKKGKTISNATIYLRGIGACVTDEKGMFMFENIPVGTYELYTMLDDGKEYVLRDVTIEANKGIQVKVMEPILAKTDKSNPWLITIIIGGSVIVCAGAVLLIVVLSKKEKIIK